MKYICSNRTLKDSYGFAIEGIILAVPGIVLPPGTAFPLRGVALTQFDGKDKLTQVDHILTNGQPPDREWTPGTGTYPVKLKIVVVRGGKEIRTVVGANAVTSIGLKID